MAPLLEFSRSVARKAVAADINISAPIDGLVDKGVKRAAFPARQSRSNGADSNGPTPRRPEAFDLVIHTTSRADTNDGQHGVVRPQALASTADSPPPVPRRGQIYPQDLARLRDYTGRRLPTSWAASVSTHQRTNRSYYAMNSGSRRSRHVFPQRNRPGVEFNRAAHQHRARPEPLRPSRRQG